MDGLRSDDESFLVAGNCDLVHNLSLVQGDVTDDIWSTPLSFILLPGGLVAMVVSKHNDSKTNITILQCADARVVGLHAMSVGREPVS